MVTRSTTYFDDPDERDGWTVTPKVWCPECCCKSCGCPTGERLLDEQANIIRGTD